MQLHHLLATVSDLVNEQFKKHMTNMGAGVVRDDEETSRRQAVPDSQYGNRTSDVYQPLMQENVCSTNERILENASNRWKDADFHPATRQNRSSRKSKKRRRRERRRLLKSGENSSVQKYSVSFLNLSFYLILSI